jgi:hypothetical protein
LDSKELEVQHKSKTSLCWKECNNVVDDNTNHRGARMIFLIMNSIDILEGVKILMMTMTNFVERLHEEAIK